ncbi:DUF11 domain-containing protein [Paenibacillus spiritus]|uniref:DUF11 domain-containing protein n=1 Tax=Paenibacillus spiritus TaxID=2496557 RepID=A0A5J5FZ85_9BACL|nr:DUF11 domain-containing protein [Paenibacillus spiritus]KAA8999670.1 DUF11 domain-containing protein [Paenibacillus spiritus]
MTEPLIVNQSLVLFQGAAGAEAIAFSNIVRTPVLGPSISLHKHADRDSAGLGDTLVFRMTVRNTGNAAAEVLLYDPLPEGLAFVPNSVLAGGLPLAGANPAAGIPVGLLLPGSEASIVFQALSVALPPSLEYRNRARADYFFTGPDGQQVRGSAESGTVTVALRAYLLEISLAVNTAATFPGDVLTYTATLRNSGLQAIREPIFAARLPAAAGWIPGSVIADGVYDPAADPQTGLLLNDLAPGQSMEVIFRARSLYIPSATEILVQSVVSYSVGGETLRRSQSSNSVSTALLAPGLTLLKTVNAVSAAPGAELRYTVEVGNPGALAAEVVLQDSPPFGTDWVPGSVTIAGAVYPELLPDRGLPLGMIRPGEFVKVQFSARVDPLAGKGGLTEMINYASARYITLLPDGRSVRQTVRSNSVSVRLAVPLLSLTAAAQPASVHPGDEAVIAVTLANSGSLPAEVRLGSLPLPGMEAVPDGLSIDGAPASYGSGGLSLGVVGPGERRIIRCRVRIREDAAGTVLSGYAAASGRYESGGQTYTAEARSNEYTVTVEGDDE